MPIDISRLLKERVSHRVAWISLLPLLSGIALLFWSALDSWFTSHPVWRTVASDIGSALLTAGAIAALWELLAKRAFRDEVIGIVKASHDMVDAGITRVYDDFRAIDWQPFLQAAVRLDIYISYGSTWRHDNDRHLQDLVTRRGGCLRVILPDPNDLTTVNELARRFSMATEDVQTSPTSAV